MLSFLIVLRSQMRVGMYAEGRGYLSDLITGTRNMGLEVIATLCANQITIKQQIEGARLGRSWRARRRQDLTSTLVLQRQVFRLHIANPSPPETAEFKEDNLVLAHEIIRMLKLFYFCVVEHLRSSEGTPTWKFAHDKTRSSPRGTSGANCFSSSARFSRTRSGRMSSARFTPSASTPKTTSRCGSCRTQLGRSRFWCSRGFAWRSSVG